MIVVAAGLLFLVSSACASYESRSGNELFTVFISDPVPESVEVLHSEDATSLTMPFGYIFGIFSIKGGKADEAT